MCNQDIENTRQLRYFYFNLTQLYTDFQELIEEIVKHYLNGLQDLLIDALPDNNEESIKQAITQLYELYLERFKEPVKKFQNTVKEIFTLPPNVLLPGETENIEKVTQEEFEELNRQITTLEEKYIQEVYYNSKLKSEIGKWENIKPLFERTNEILEFIKRRKNKDEKSIKDLFDALQTCEEFYFNCHNKNAVEDKTKKILIDKYNMLKAKQ